MVARKRTLVDSESTPPLKRKRVQNENVPPTETAKSSPKANKPSRVQPDNLGGNKNPPGFVPHVDGKGPSLVGSWRSQIETEEPLQPGLCEGGKMLKIAVWNVNGLRSVLKSPPKNGGSRDSETDLRLYMETEKPDILFLNETKVDASLEEKMEDAIAGEISDKVQFEWVHSDKKGYAGVAAIIQKNKKFKLEDVRRGMGDEEHDSEGRCLTLIFESIVLVTTYVANAGQGLHRLDYRIKRFDHDLHAYLKNLRRELNREVVWCGDLNVAFEEIDIWNSKGNIKSAGHTPEERASFGNFLSKGDWVDVWRAQNPTTRRYSFWPARAVQSRVQNLGWRLDYFVATSGLLKQVQGCCIRDKFKGSDHCPVVLTLELF